MKRSLFTCIYHLDIFQQNNLKITGIPLLNPPEQDITHASYYGFSITHVVDIKTDAEEQQDHMGATITIATTSH